MKKAVYGAVLGLKDILADWRYALPLVVNLTGSVWFFLLIGQAGELGWFCSLFVWRAGGREYGNGGCGGGGRGG